MLTPEYIPCIKVDVVSKFDFDVSDCVKVDLWFYGKEEADFIYYERYLFRRGIEDKLLLKGLRTDVPKIIVTNFCRKRTLRARGSVDHLCSCIDTMKRLENGYVSIHGACVAKDGEAILMPAMPNTGKTLTTLQLLNNGYDYMADDTIIVDGMGTAYFTPMSSAVGPYILGYVDKLSRLKHAELHLRTFLRSFPGATKFVRPFMGRAWELVEGAKTVPSAKVKIVCLLEVGPKSLEELDKECAVSKITAINRYSLPHPQSNPVILAYTLFNPQFDLTLFEARGRSILSEILDKTECYLVRCRDGQWGELVEKTLRR